MVNDLISLIVRANLVMAAAIVLVMLLRIPARRYFGARVAYVMWTLPLFAAAMVFAPARIVNIVLDTPLDMPLEAPVPPVDATAPLSISLWDVLLWTWVGGVFLSIVILALRQFRFLRALGRLHARADLGARVLAAESTTHGPAIIGVVRPVIITPADFDSRFDAEERRIILAHERAHVAQGDPWVNAVVSLVQCLTWFNPFVHFGARALRIDQELACDAAVLEQEGVRRRYAETMLKTQLAAPIPIGCAWPPNSLTALKERISMLKRTLPTRTQTLAGASVVALVIAAACAAAWAVQPAHVVATSSVALEKPSYLIDASYSTPRLDGGDDGDDQSVDDMDINVDFNSVHFGDGRRWGDLTPEEQQEVRDSMEEARQQLREAREQVRQALRDAQQSSDSREEALDRAREAAEEARQQLEETRAEREQALQEAQQALQETQAEREQALQEAQQQLEATRAEREQAMREARVQVAQAQAALAQMPDVQMAIDEARADVEREAMRARADGRDDDAEAMERAARSMRDQHRPVMDQHRRQRLHGQEIRKHGLR